MKMKKRLFVLMLCVALAATAAPRTVVSLSGPGWSCDGEPVSVPHTWNAGDGADGPGGTAPVGGGDSAESGSYRRTSVTYRRALPDAPSTRGRRTFLRFEGVSQVAVVKVNGRTVGRHVGAFTAFCCEATAALRPTGNVLEVEVDNTYNPDIPPMSADFTLFGGLYRDVWLIETPAVCIDPVTDGADGVTLDIDVPNRRVTAHARVLGGDDVTRVFEFPDADLWTPETPHLYRVTVRAGVPGDEDSVTVPFGFRTAEFRADGFYLNGVRRRLRGMNRHQDLDGRGWALSRADEERDIDWVKAIGADALRTAHYPQSRHVYDLCDEKGLVVWAEMPNVNGLPFTDAYAANARTLAREMVAQNRHHPSIVLWSVFNELYNRHPMTPGKAEAFVADLAADVRALDATRPVAGATNDAKLEALNALPDVLAFNFYPGWYGENADTAAEEVAEMFRRTGRSSLGISEYGAGGSVRHHGAADRRVEPGGKFHPEEYQAYLHWRVFKALAGEDRLWGTFVWALFDFAADRRTEGERDGINDKGLVTYDRTTAKDAFWLYAANWTHERVLHLVGTRQNETACAERPVLGFSNCGDVTLVVNGRTVGTQSPDCVRTVFWPKVPLAPGRNVIELRAGGRTVRHELVRTAAEGVESEAAAGGTGAAYRHLKVTAWTLRDRTDRVGELVEKREWLLLPGTAAFELTCPVAAVEDMLAGTGVVYLRLAPLPGSRTWADADFRVEPDSRAGLVALERPDPCLEIPYAGGAAGRRRALVAAQRRLRPYVAGRDGLFLSNTWGDRNRDARICASFIRQEIDAAAKIGIDVVQIDDGWQKGRTANSASAAGTGAWGGYWSADPDFWQPDPTRFPDGLGPVADYARAHGVRLGLWFGPDSSDDAANWSRDAELLLRYHRDYGISHYKIDSMKTTSARALERQRALFDTVRTASGGQVVFDLDVTAEVRPGYFGLPEIGPVFVENRYTDWHKYWPHQTLRQFWSLSEVVDSVRLRMELPNLRRNADKYAGDPLAPANWPIESAFASVMLASPLGWFEASGLGADDVARLAPFVATWKGHRARLHGGVTFPVAARPDGVSWTGFVVACADGGGYALLFRELSDTAEFALDLSPYVTADAATVLSPRGAARLEGATLRVRVPEKLDFVWVELSRNE